MLAAVGLLLHCAVLQARLKNKAGAQSTALLTGPALQIAAARTAPLSVRSLTASVQLLTESRPELQALQKEVRLELRNRFRLPADTAFQWLSRPVYRAVPVCRCRRRSSFTVLSGTQWTPVSGEGHLQTSVRCLQLAVQLAEGSPAGSSLMRSHGWRRSCAGVTSSGAPGALTVCAAVASAALGLERPCLPAGTMGTAGTSLSKRWWRGPCRW